MWIGGRVELGREGDHLKCPPRGTQRREGGRKEGRRKVPFPILSRADPRPLSHGSSFLERFQTIFV